MNSFIVKNAEKCIGKGYKACKSLTLNINKINDQNTFDCIGVVIFSLHNSGFDVRNILSFLSKNLYKTNDFIFIEKFILNLEGLGFVVLENNNNLQHGDILILYMQNNRLHFAIVAECDNIIKIIHANSEIGKITIEIFDSHLKKHLINIIRL